MVDIRGIFESIRDRIPKFRRGREEDKDKDFSDEGVDLEDDLEKDLESPDIDEEPEEPSEPEPEDELEPEPAHEPEPQPGFPQELPPAPTKPLPSPASSDISEQLKRLTNRFETLQTELEMIKSEAELEKSMLEKYDYYLKEMNSKLTLLEQQHESLWNELQAKKTQ